MLVSCAGDDAATGGTDDDTSDGGSSTASTGSSASDGEGSSSSGAGSSSSSDGASTSADTSGSTGASESESDSGSSGSSDESTTGAAGVCADEALAGYASAVAIRFADIPPSGMDDTGDSSGPDPDALLFSVRSYASSCDDDVYGTPCDGQWSVLFQLAPDQQAPGVYDMETVNGSISWTNMGSCAAGGGGTSVTGTLEIVSIDDDEVVGRFCGIEADFGAPPIADGEWTAERCP